MNYTLYDRSRLCQHLYRGIQKRCRYKRTVNAGE